MMTIKRIKDLYPSPISNNIFLDLYKIDNQIFSSVISSEEEALSIGIEYVYNHAYNLKLSPLLMKLLSGYVIDDNYQYVVHDKKKIIWDEFIDEFESNLLYKIIKVRYKNKWLKLFNAITMKYNPIEPFKTVIEDKLLNDDMTSSTNNTTQNHKTTDDSGVYPFNLSSTEKVVPTNKDESSTTYNDNSSYKRENTHTRTATRSGNIGNLSSQKLLAEEWELYKRQLIDVIFDDLDNLLVRNLY